MNRRQCLVLASVTALLLLSVPAVAFVQRTPANFSGTVTDPAALVPGTHITVTKTATSLTIAVSTAQAGMYVIPNMAAETYRVAIGAAGFRPVSPAVRNILKWLPVVQPGNGLHAAGPE